MEVDAAGSIARNYAYCHFAKDGLSEEENTTEPFIEAYNLMEDPSQAINLAVLDDTDGRKITYAERTTYEARITQLKGCAGQIQCATTEAATTEATTTEAADGAPAPIIDTNQILLYNKRGQVLDTVGLHCACAVTTI